MKQPKFKFGDKVIFGSIGDKSLVFTVKVIDGDTGKYFYGERNHSSELYSEEYLELYQEPQKKKLYAYYQVDSFDSIVFKCTEKHDDPRPLIRDPEYDIEYNAEALCKEQENTERR